MAYHRLTGVHISVFQINTSQLIGIIQDCDVDVDTKEVEGKAIYDRWDYPIPVGSSWTVNATMYVDSDYGDAVTTAIVDPTVSVIVNTGKESVSGTAVMTKASHSIKHEGIQTQKVTLKGQGAPPGG